MRARSTPLGIFTALSGLKAPRASSAGCAAVWRRILVIVVQAYFANHITHRLGDDHRG